MLLHRGVAILKNYTKTMAGQPAKTKGLNRQLKKCTYSKVPAQSVFQAILCGVEEMPSRTDGHFCPGLQQTLGVKYTFYLHNVDYLALKVFGESP